MDIRPTEPPGRSTRKARGYGDQIRHLAAEGYSLVLIREALAKAGVVVSKSTVQREASRSPSQGTHQVPQPAAPNAPPPANGVASPGDPNSARGAPLALPRGKDVAEAFMSGRITNPLLRKDQP